jgi:hypothetical protein
MNHFGDWSSRLPGRRGMAMVVALVFAFCLLIMVFGIFKAKRNTTTQTKLSLIKAQAAFGARAAMQHFLLKARLFPTELYDGVEFGEGKNPLFDFTEFEDGGRIEDKEFTFEKRQEIGQRVYTRVSPSQEKVNTPMPGSGVVGQFKYFYTELPGKPGVLVRLGSRYNPEYRFLGGNTHSDASMIYTHRVFGSVDRSHKRFLYANYYIGDCCNGEGWQPSLAIKIGTKVANRNSWSLDGGSGQDGFPYTMEYRVKAVEVQAMQGLRRYNEEAIKIVVEGKATDFHGETFQQELQMVQKITRKGAIP